MDDSTINHIIPLLKKQGKTLEWLAEKTGYSIEEVTKIAEGEDDHLSWTEKDKIARVLNSTALRLFHLR